MIQFQVSIHLKFHHQAGTVLFQLEQMSGYIGQTVALRLISAVDNRRKFQAKLVAVDLENEMIQVEVEKQQVLEIDSHNIDKANLVFQD